MKTMTCKQLGGVCDEIFQADTFDEIAQLSMAHGTQMFQKQDIAHLEVMNEMRELMQKPEELSKWIESKKELFDALPED